jgi:hypothetical protein
MKKLALFSAGLLCCCVSVSVAQDVCTPAKVISLAVGAGKTTAAISWTAPGDDCNSGTATLYDLRYSTSLITEANFGSATPIAMSAPQVAGSEECVKKTGLSCNTTYYFALKTTDDAGFVSPLSNVVTRATSSCGSSTEVDCP